MGTRGAFRSIAAILIGFVIGVPLLGAVFASDGPYDQLVELPLVGPECVYGPGSSMFIPGQTEFELTGITAFEAMEADETIRVEGTVTAQNTAYLASQIELKDEAGATLETLQPGFAFHIDDGEGNQKMIGVGNSAALAKFDCEPDNRFSLVSMETRNLDGYCDYGPGSGYGGTIGGIWIDQGIFRVLAPTEIIEIPSDGLLAARVSPAGQLTFNDAPIASGIAYGVDLGPGQPLALVGFTNNTAALPIHCTGTAPGTSVDAETVDPSVPSGNLAFDVNTNGATGNVSIKKGGTVLTDSPYSGILVAVIALIPLLAIAYFAFRFGYQRVR